MNALGLIETKGLLASIIALDTMLKTANIVFVEKSIVGGGLVSILIDGDIASVKAAIESGVSSIKSIDEKLFISQNIIARPHESLEKIIFGNKEIGTLNEIVIEEVEEDETEIEVNKEVIEIAKDIKVDIEKLESNDETLVEEVVKEENNLIILDRENLGKYIKNNGIEKAIEVLKVKKVSEIRKLAVEFEEINKLEQKISKTSKKNLIKNILETYKTLI